MLISRSILKLVSPVTMLLLFLGASAKFEQPKTQQASRPSLVLQRGHSLGVNCAAYSHDGSWIASGGNDNSIVIWQTSSGRELRSLIGHRGYVRSVAVSADGKLIASGGNDRSVRVWDVAKGAEKWVFTGHAGPVVSVKFSPDGKWLVTGSADKTLKIWDLSAPREAQTLTNHTAPLSGLAFSKSGQYLVSAAGPEAITWSLGTWQVKQTMRREGTNFTAVAFTDDEQSIALGAADGSVLSWRMGTNREKFITKPNPSSVLTIRVSSDSVSSVHADGGLTVADLATGTLKRSLPGSASRPPFVFASFAPDGSTYASSEGSRVITIRNSNTAENTLSLDTHSTAISSLAVSPDGRWIAAATHDSSIRLWQVATGRELPRLKGHAGKVTTVAFSPDNNLIASGSRSGEVKIWDVTTNQLSFSFPSKVQGVNNVAFSPDGSSLAVVGMNPTVELWTLSDKQFRPLNGHTKEITSVTFADRGNSLVTAGRDKSIRVWDTKSGTLSTTFENSTEINSLAVTSSGDKIAVGNTDGSIKVFNLKDPNSAQTLSGHSNEVLSLRFSSDDTHILSGSLDRTAIIWDLAAGTISKRLAGNSDAVTSIAETKDGTWVLAGSDDGSILVWNKSSGNLGATLISMPNSDDWLVATPDGLFDGSPESWELMLWRFDQETFNVLPVESYFNEFFSPGVLAELFANKNPKAINDIVLKDRRQPLIVLRTSPSDDKRRAAIEIDVTAIGADATHADDSGAKDLRLFRNGLMVKTWTGDLIRTGKSIKLQATVPVVAGPNRFSAYVFNNDDIKSASATIVIQGDESLRRKGTAYLLLVGVNQYSNPEYNLRYAVADVEGMEVLVRSNQEKISRYDPVVTIPLVDKEATKANVLLALDRLAGTNTAALPVNAPASLSRIKRAQPEDAIFIYFSGHGYSNGNNFYLIPHDLGYAGKRKELDSAGLKQMLAHGVSDNDLERALQPLDADQVLLIIDACYSGQAVNSTEERRGPMNTKGLAQLSYEKGMYILTASQDIEVAFEAEIFKHSYLAYALLEEGLKKGEADSNKDGDIFLREWFEFANNRVPQLRKQRFIRKELVEEEDDDQKVQRPRVFYTREEGAKTFLIGKREHASK